MRDKRPATSARSKCPCGEQCQKLRRRLPKVSNDPAKGTLWLTGPQPLSLLCLYLCSAASPRGSPPLGGARPIARHRRFAPLYRMTARKASPSGRSPISGRRIQPLKGQVPKRTREEAEGRSGGTKQSGFGVREAPAPPAKGSELGEVTTPDTKGDKFR